MAAKIISRLKKNVLVQKFYFPLVWLREYLHKTTHKKKYFFKDLFSNVYKGSLVVRINNINGQFEIDARSDLLQRVLVKRNMNQKLLTYKKLYKH